MDNNNLRQDVQVPNWGNLEDYSYTLPQFETFKLAGEGLFYTRIGDLTSFVIRFTDPRHYTENLQIRIIEETTEDVVLDVVPFEVAKGYGIRAFYILTQPRRVRIDIKVDGVPIPRIIVGVDVNDDYVHSLEISNLALLRLLNQQTGKQRQLQAVYNDQETARQWQLQAVYNELNKMMVELPNICQTAIESVILATERSTEIINRAHRLIQEFQQPPGPAPPVSPTAQGDQSPRDGSPPAPPVSPTAQGDQSPRDGSPPARNRSPPAPSVPVAVGPSLPEFRRRIRSRRASTPSSLHSEQPGVTRQEGRQPDGLKRKSADDMGEEEPVKRGRWSAPSAMARAEDRASCSASPPRSNGTTSPVSSVSTDVMQQLHDFLDTIIEGAQEDEGPSQDRPPVPNQEEVSWRLAMTPSPIERPFSAHARMNGLEKSWSLRFSISPTHTDNDNRAPPRNVEEEDEEDDPFQCNQLWGFETLSNPETISSTTSKMSGSVRPVVTAMSRNSLERASSEGSIQGSPCPLLSSRSSRPSSTSRRSRVSSVGAIRGSTCPSLASADEEDSPQRNPRYNPHYWLRPIGRKNYRL